jgi:putative FmdB family regulatory protein
MPIKEFECEDCQTVYEALIRNTQDLKEVSCPKCSSIKAQVRLTFPSNYEIKGNNSASVRPKRGMAGN